MVCWVAVSGGGGADPSPGPDPEARLCWPRPTMTMTCWTNHSGREVIPLLFYDWNPPLTRHETLHKHLRTVWKHSHITQLFFLAVKKFIMVFTQHTITASLSRGSLPSLCLLCVSPGPEPEFQLETVELMQMAPKLHKNRFYLKKILSPYGKSSGPRPETCSLKGISNHNQWS